MRTDLQADFKKVIAEVYAEQGQNTFLDPKLIKQIPNQNNQVPKIGQEKFHPEIPKAKIIKRDKDGYVKEY